MKKRWQTIIALCLALTLALGLALPAWAEDPGTALRINPDETGTITLSGMDEGATATAYQVITVQYDYDTGSPKEPVYSWVNDVASWVRTDYSTYIGTGTDNSVQDDYNSSLENGDAIKNFADALAAEIRTNGGTMPSQEAQDDKFTGLEMGTYLIIVEGGTQIYRPVLVNLVPTWDKDSNGWVLNPSTVNVSLKASGLTLLKTVSEQQVAIGDIVTYTLVADVPQFLASAVHKGYHISDLLPDGMTLNPGSIEVYGGNEATQNTPLNKGTAYTLTTTSATRPVDGKPPVTFNLQFNYDEISTYQKIKVTYMATANKDIIVKDSAVQDGGNNKNTAYLDYNNDPYADTESWKTVTAAAEVYSYGIKVSKVDKDNTNTLLSGATFTLSKDQIDADPIQFVSVNSEQGIYRKAAGTEAGTTTTTALTVGSADGRIGQLTLSGLDVGTYYLTETKAPGGYNKLSAPVAITITDDTPNGKPESKEGEYSDGYVTLTVENSKGFTLPETGGMGTVLFTAGGVLLMGVGAVLLAVYLRRRTRAK